MSPPHSLYRQCLADLEADDSESEGVASDDLSDIMQEESSDEASVSTDNPNLLDEAESDDQDSDIEDGRSLSASDTAGEEPDSSVSGLEGEPGIMAFCSYHAYKAIEM